MPRSIEYFKDMPDYKEAFEKDGPVYFGSRPALAEYYDDINKYGISADSHGRVYYPEGRNATPSYEKNKAFWAGLIKKKRPLILVTPITAYTQLEKGTVDEMLWLKDNGYSFTLRKDGTTLVSPPNKPVSNPVIRDYGNGHGSDAVGNEDLRLQSIKNEAISNGQNPPKNKDSIKEVENKEEMEDKEEGKWEEKDEIKMPSRKNKWSQISAMTPVNPGASDPGRKSRFTMLPTLRSQPQKASPTETQTENQKKPSAPEEASKPKTAWQMWKNPDETVKNPVKGEKKEEKTEEKIEEKIEESKVEENKSTTPGFTKK